MRRPRRIFSSFGNGGKNNGGGGWPGTDESGILGGAEVNALRLCAYARSSGYGSDATPQKKLNLSEKREGKGAPPVCASLIATIRSSASLIIFSNSLFPFSISMQISFHLACIVRRSALSASILICLSWWAWTSSMAAARSVSHLRKASVVGGCDLFDWMGEPRERRRDWDRDCRVVSGSRSLEVVIGLGWFENSVGMDRTSKVVYRTRPDLLFLFPNTSCPQLSPADDGRLPPIVCYVRHFAVA